MSVTSAPRASQLSGSTAFNSTTSLSSISSMSTMVAPNNGQVVATANIINQKADASRSLFQICVALKQRLALLPGFEDCMDRLDQMADIGPVESLWSLLRTGYPLVTIYNSVNTASPLQIEEGPTQSDSKRAKIAILKFVAAAKKELGLPESDSFIINDVIGDDTTGFVKVLSAINYVLDIAERNGLLRQSVPYPEDDTMQAGSQMSYRDYIVRELVDTERKYVQDLENLYDLKKTLEQKGAIPGDTVHQIFLNVNAILDFQRRFLIRVETTNSMPQSRQEWGAPFVINEEAFHLYQPFIANQRKAAQVASEVFDKIQAAGHPVACDFNTLDGFLLKPMQRLVKYPLLLKDLMKKSDDETAKADLSMGILAAERVLQKANEAVDRDLLDEALEDLTQRVTDWKNHRVDQFGKLLLHGVHAVVTGRSEQEKDYEIYLFECILLCCKEVNAAKSKDKKDKTKSTGPKPKGNKGGPLQLKGRIFMTNVTDVVAISKTGSYTVQIWWKGDPGVENFMIKFQNEEMMKKWASGLLQQQKENAPQASQSPDQPPPNFTWMSAQTGGLENPYAQHDDDDDDDDEPYSITPTGVPQYQVALPGTMQRNASTTSLRQRSATGESIQSLAGIARQPPPRFPMPQPPAPLSLQTQGYPQQSPGPRGGDSYFSPVAESPASSRTSTTSGFFPPSAGYPFPKTGTPQPGGWGSGDDNNRYTAPAMPRAPSRDGPSPVNAYGMVGANGRNPRGPSMPVMPRDPAAQMQQQRSRSYSTPDINGQANARRMNGQSVPAVPGIPAHIHATHERHDSTIPRSNTGSPANDLPIRTSTQSPGAQRAKEAKYGGTMVQFPSQPLYRQGTPNGGMPPPPGPPPPGMAPLAPIDPNAVIAPSLATAPLPGHNPLASPNPADAMPMPTQLKVKVQCDRGIYITLVVAFNITYQSLVDRIDAKLARAYKNSISKGDLKLQYRDEDGDYVSIEGDDDIQIAISEWRESVQSSYMSPGGVGEIELFCRGELG